MNKKGQGQQLNIFVKILLIIVALFGLLWGLNGMYIGIAFKSIPSMFNLSTTGLRIFNAVTGLGATIVSILFFLKIRKE